MKIHDVEQGSPEWLACRLGIPTASEFDRIITPTGKPSTQDEAYANRLIAEIMTGKPVDEYEGNSWMVRGRELEAEAVRFYELQRDVETVKVGFVTDDARTMGCSPDRLVGDDGLLEIKCPAPHTHVQYLIEERVDRKYYTQVQGQMLVTDRQWADLMSYHPEMPPVITRIRRDVTYLAFLSELLVAFSAKLQAKKQKLIELGHLELKEEEQQAMPSFLRSGNAQEIQ